MVNPKDILVTTTSTVDGLQVKQYLRPISAHIVAGTNLFSDFFASFTDVLGGRSGTYQKQISSLYNEAIERLRVAAFEMGANSIIGLQVDLDEISGKGKSMFMVTAIGTAVIVERQDKRESKVSWEEKFENVSIDKIRMLQYKREILQRAQADQLKLDDDIWDFITNNHVYEVYDYVISQFQKAIRFSMEAPEAYNNFYKRLLTYLDALPAEKKTALLYESIATVDNETLFLKLADTIGDLHLLDLEQVNRLIALENFQMQKRATKIITYDKLFYSSHDIEQLRSISEKIKTKFKERGSRSMKKQLLSSKEKEVWTCECGKTNDIGAYCAGCRKDIYGFTAKEITPPYALKIIEEKIGLISEYVEI